MNALNQNLQNIYGKTSNNIKIVFAGTPEFAVPTLKGLFEAGYNICRVYTQPDRPAGRGQILTESPVKQFAKQHHLSIYQPTSLKDPEQQKILAQLQPDLIIVVAYGLLLPQVVLDIPTCACLNVHASLLPRWRGAAPIQRAILSGDVETGITIMQMEVELDTGPMLSRESCAITSTDTSATLHDRLAEIGAQTLLNTLKILQTNHLPSKIQDNALACYAHKITKEEAHIDWQKSAIDIDRLIRAFNPWPIAHTNYQGQLVKIWQATLFPEKKPAEKPGTILDLNHQLGIEVATGNGSLRLLKLQTAGSRVMSTDDFLNGHGKHWKTGICLGV